jgi:hypothetical protein
MIGTYRGRSIIQFPPSWSPKQIADWCEPLATVEAWKEFREDYYGGLMVCPFGEEWPKYGGKVRYPNAPFGMSVHGMPKLHPDDE